jgi:hypothetical protein
VFFIHGIHFKFYIGPGLYGCETPKNDVYDDNIEYDCVRNVWFRCVNIGHKQICSSCQYYTAVCTDLAPWLRKTSCLHYQGLSNWFPAETRDQVHKASNWTQFLQSWRQRQLVSPNPTTLQNVKAQKNYLKNRYSENVDTRSTTATTTTTTTTTTTLLLLLLYYYYYYYSTTTTTSVYCC